MCGLALVLRYELGDVVERAELPFRYVGEELELVGLTVDVVETSSCQCEVQYVVDAFAGAKYVEQELRG